MFASCSLTDTHSTGFPHRVWFCKKTCFVGFIIQKYVVHVLNIEKLFSYITIRSRFKMLCMLKNHKFLWTSVSFEKLSNFLLSYQAQRCHRKYSRKQHFAWKISRFAHSLGKSQQSTSKDNKRNAAQCKYWKSKSNLMQALHQN